MDRGPGLANGASNSIRVRDASDPKVSPRPDAGNELLAYPEVRGVLRRNTRFIMSVKDEAAAG